MRHLLSTFLLVFAVMLAGCAECPRQTVTHGKHVILYSSLPPKKAGQIQEEADSAVREISRFLDLDPPQKRVEVLMFASRRALRRYLQRESPHHAGAAAVIFVTDEAYTIAMSRNRRRAKVLRCLRHELAHYVLAGYYPRLPPWVNEGLAMFFEPSAQAGRVHPPCLKTIIRQLRNDEGDILSRLITLPEGVQFDSRGYAQAWSLVHFLLLDPRYGPAALKDYMAGFNSGADAEEQFRKSFDYTPDEMESSWREYLIRLEAGDSAAQSARGVYR